MHKLGNSSMYRHGTDVMHIDVLAGAIQQADCVGAT